MQRVIVYGASGFGKVICDVLGRLDEFEIAGIVDDDPHVGASFCGHRVIGTGEDIAGIAASEGVTSAIVAIGENWTRGQVAKKIQAKLPGFQFPSVVSPFAEIGRDVVIGEGCFIGHGAIVNTGSRVGRFCVINTKAALDHDGVMGDFSSLAPNVAVGGIVQIGTYSAVSLGANVIHNVRIGEQCVIGAGALVLRDIEDYALAYGTPARVIRKRSAGEHYLGILR